MHLVDDFYYKIVGVFLSCVLTCGKKTAERIERCPRVTALVRSCSCSSAQLFPAERRDILVPDALHLQPHFTSN